jgi:hypothetical protein
MKTGLDSKSLLPEICWTGFIRSGLFQNDPDKANSGLLSWAPGNAQAHYQDIGKQQNPPATGDEKYRIIEDRLADFLIRIQVGSENHRELDGGWFRAFDYRQWEYWGSNADAGWGSWSIETGWTQAWIPKVLAMRELNKNLWDITGKSEVDKHFESIRRQMIPDTRDPGL